MHVYNLSIPRDPKSVLPPWHFEQATRRQLKVLLFFGIDIGASPTKGVCSGIIGRLFSEPSNKHLWTAYVYTTGDEDDTSTNLHAHDKLALAQVQIPEGWQPKRSPGKPSSSRKVLEQIIGDILKDGSPFNDPLPAVTIAGTAFCFTGDFEFGTRKECQKAVTNRGGSITDGITRKTEVLVIGNDPNPNWSHSSYGNKIAEGMILRMQHSKPHIIPELYWKELLSQQPEII